MGLQRISIKGEIHTIVAYHQNLNPSFCIHPKVRKSIKKEQSLFHFTFLCFTLYYFLRYSYSSFASSPICSITISGFTSLVSMSSAFVSPLNTRILVTSLPSATLISVFRRTQDIFRYLLLSALPYFRNQE